MAKADAAPGDWFGQPRGLTILFLTEMWDQFSFFGMRALLVLYMTKHLAIAQQTASLIYGLYAAFVYLTPIFGGIITDRWLGRTRAVVLGGLIMAAGHFMMAFEPLLYVALATIALGNGLFLPSLPSQIDSLYAPDDPRRKSAYNVYYVGINIGALMAPLVVGTLGETLGFHFGFAAAGIGMIVALATYIGGRRYLPPDPLPAARAAAGSAAARPLLTPAVTQRLALLVGIAAVVVVFRGAYEQIGNTMALWAADGVDRQAGGFLIPVTWFQSINPLVVFLFTPVLVVLWTRQAARGREPSSGVKMAVGAAIVGASYLVCGAVAAWSLSHGVKAGWIWLAAFNVLMTTGELYSLPVGLGLFGRLAPAGLRATAIATWFSAGFAGNLLAGWLGGYWSRLSQPTFFAVIGGVALLAAGLLAFVSPRVRREETLPP